MPARGGIRQGRKRGRRAPLATSMSRTLPHPTHVKRYVSVVAVAAIAHCPSGPGWRQVHAGNPMPRPSEFRSISVAAFVDRRQESIRVSGRRSNERALRSLRHLSYPDLPDSNQRLPTRRSTIEEAASVLAWPWVRPLLRPVSPSSQRREREPRGRVPPLGALLGRWAFRASTFGSRQPIGECEERAG
jgi:hypothetical protein